MNQNGRPGRTSAPQTGPVQNAANPASRRGGTDLGGNLKAIIENGDTQTMIEVAEAVGKRAARRQEQNGNRKEWKGLETHQVRRLFGSVRLIGMGWKADSKKAQRQLLLLRPRLAYQHKRVGGEMDELDEVLSGAIGLVEDSEERFNNFMDFFEAIVAYHRVNSQD